MLGAIAGDVAGSTREFHPIKTKDFPLFVEASTATDDSILTVAVGTAILDGADFGERLGDFARAHPTSYGLTFYDWAYKGDGKPYGSWGNGASMRVSPAAWLACDLTEALDIATRSAAATHDHPEGIRGARATTLAIYLGRCGWSAAAIREAVERTSGYDLSRTVDDLRPGCVFEVKSSVSVPEAIICALEALSFEDAIRNAVSLGGDADTQAAIAGSIAEAVFGVPEHIAAHARKQIGMWGLLADVDRMYTAVKPAVDPGRAAVAAIVPFDPAASVAWNRRHLPPEPPPREFDWDYFMSGVDEVKPRRETGMARVGRMVTVTLKAWKLRGSREL
jgi:ADP-ribosylglycohydrolase